MYSANALAAVADAPLKGVSMLKLSFPPLWKMHTSARYSPFTGGAAFAMELASRKFSSVFKTGMLLTPAQLAWRRKRRRERDKVFMAA